MTCFSCWTSPNKGTKRPMYGQNWILIFESLSTSLWFTIVLNWSEHDFKLIYVIEIHFEKYVLKKFIFDSNFAHRILNKLFLYYQISSLSQV